MNFNGDITGGDKRIRTYLHQGYYGGGGYSQSQERLDGSDDQRDEHDGVLHDDRLEHRMDRVAGDGQPARGPTDAGPDQDKQHFVRFGKNDGLATLAIGASNARGAAPRCDAPGLRQPGDHRQPLQRWDPRVATATSASSW